jgi:hypothetical protein
MSLFKNIKFLDTIRPKLVSVLNHSTFTSAVDARNQVDKIQFILDAIQPVIEFVKHPDKETTVGLLPYAVTAVVILSLSALVFGIVWKKGTSLNTFMKTQYDKLTEWTQQTYLNVSKRKLEREKERQLQKLEQRTRDEEEKIRRDAEAESQSWSSYFKSKMTNVGPDMIKKLLDPTDKSSWGVLSALWVQYLSGIRVPGVQSQLPLDAVVVATVAKFAVFVGYLIQLFIREHISGYERDSLMNRLSDAILVNFLDLLHLQLKKVKLSDDSKSDEDKISQLKTQISQLEVARKALRENIVELNRSTSSQTTPTKLAEKVRQVRQTQSELEASRKALIQQLLQLILPKMYNIQPLHLTEFSGGTYEKSFWGAKFKPNDSIYLKVWISLAEDVLSFVDSQETVTTELHKLETLTDKSSTRKTHGWPGYPRPWDNFMNQKTKLMGKSWEDQRDSLMNLRKFIALYILQPSQDIVSGVQLIQEDDEKQSSSSKLKFGVPVEVLKTLNNSSPVKKQASSRRQGDEEIFTTPKSRLETPTLIVKKNTPRKSFSLSEFVSDKDQSTLKKIKSELEHIVDKSSIEKQNEHLDRLIKSSQDTVNRIEQSAKTQQSIYVKSVANLFYRHQLTILVSKVACQLLKYLVALRDSYDTSVALYIQNRTLTFKSKDFLTNSRNFLDIVDIYNHLSNEDERDSEINESTYSIKNSNNYITYEESLNMIYMPLKKGYESKYANLLKLLKGLMCQIYHITEQLQTDRMDGDRVGLVDENQVDLISIKQLYNIQSQCTVHEHCEDCECDKVKHEKEVKRPTFKPHTSKQNL